MQTALLKEYVSKAKDLELSCYEQKLLCDNLEQKLSHINYQRKNKENEKKEFKKFSWINYIASAIWWGISVLPPLIGISMLVGVALYIIALICGIMHFSIPFIDRIYIFLKTYPVIGITICSKYLHNLYHTKKHIIYNLKLYITCRIQKVYKALMIIPGLSEPPVRTLRATIPENESHIFR